MKKQTICKFIQSVASCEYFTGIRFLYFMIAMFVLSSVFVKAQTGSIKLTSVSGKLIDGKAGQNIILNVEVGTSEAVANIVGLSFHIEWDNQNLVQPVGILRGSFLGNDQLFISQTYADRFEAGLSSTTGGHSGSGIAATCTLQVKQNISGIVPLSLALTHISAINNEGQNITLAPQKNPITILLCDTKPLVITSPGNMSCWGAGSRQSVTWNSTSIANVRLEYSTDNGNNWNTITESVSASLHSYEWTVPDTPSEQCRIRISDASDPEIMDISSSTFTIFPADQVFGPYFADDHTVALYHFDNNFDNSVSLPGSAVPYNTISFVQNSDIGLNYGLRIDNSGAAYSCVDIPHSNSLSMTGDWTVELWFKIVSWGSGTTVYPFLLSKTGANYFITLTPGSKSLEAGFDYEGGGEHVFLPNNSLNLNTWYHLAFVKNSADNTLRCYLHGTDRKIITSAKATYNKAHVPKINTNPVSIGGIHSPGNIQFNGFVDELRISNVAREFRKIELMTPASGEVLQSGSKYSISWNCRSIKLIKIEYSTNNGTSWNTIASNVDGTAGTYTWTVPSASSDKCKIRISDQSDAGFYYISSSPFTIKQRPVVTLVQPNGGADWVAGTTQNISWLSTNVSSVKLEYTTDNGAGWISITDSIPASPSDYNWLIPNTPSSQCKVRISDVTDPGISDISNSVFTISPVSGIEKLNSAVPESFGLCQNYPNPFNPVTRIRYAVPASSFVRISVYDILGNETARLVNGMTPAGYYEVEFSGYKLSSGIYFLKMNAEGYSSMIKMMLVK